jgi:peptide/nickel transport system substrate-binding protein
MSKKLFSILGLLVIASMVLVACGQQVVTEVVKETQVVKQTEVVTVKETEVVTVKETQIVEVTAVPEPTAAPVVTRKGAWVDSVVFTSIDQADQAVAQLQAGDIDVYAYTVADPEVFKTVNADPALQYSTALGSYNEMTFNPAAFGDTTRLNPFAVPAVREAMNWLIDRDNVVQNIYGGLAVAKLLPLNSSFADYTRYVDVARELEAYYAYNPDKANEVISAEMEKLGATKGGDGKWMYQDNPVTIIMIIRTEDQRKQIGDYVANQLESIGFTVDRQYKTRSEASPIWNQSNPVDGLWHIYTGGWITTAISRDDGTNFAYFYTNLGSGSPLWQAYVNTPEYYEVAEKLWTNKFATMDERAELFKTAMRLCLQDSARVWIIDQISFAPLRSDTSIAYDLAGGIAGSQLWPFTVQKNGVEGGTVRIAQPGILVEPWNPVAGSNWIYDSMPRRATEDFGTVADPYTGLAWPQRIEKAEITVKAGLPVAKTLDWVTLNTADSIEVPADAWVDWDAVNQKFLTAGEVYTAGLPTANTKRVVTYPSSLWETKWHDGSNLSMGDFVMGMIITFDRAKAESAIYDESAVPAFESFMSVFKGVKVVSTDPLVIETYSDAYALDAELMATDWYPSSSYDYGFGTAGWHNLGLGVRAESEKLLTFSVDKADALKTENEKIEWMSFITGPSLEILNGELISATAESYLPYAPTLGQYVDADEIAARYKNLGRWYAEQGHFWIGTGPFYLNKAFPVEQTLSLARNPEYPDLADKWSGFGTPKIATAEVDGPGEVSIGSEAKFDVYVTFGDAPYANADIDGVKYLVFDSKGVLVASGEAAVVEEGVFQVVLSADVTSKLEAGSNKIEVAVTSKLVSIPSFAAYEFVTK